jgi:hypothetical protein
MPTWSDPAFVLATKIQSMKPFQERYEPNADDAEVKVGKPIRTELVYLAQNDLVDPLPAEGRPLQ